MTDGLNYFVTGFFHMGHTGRTQPSANDVRVTGSDRSEHIQKQLKGCVEPGRQEASKTGVLQYQANPPD
jgi:hypothetical protein